MHTAIIYGILLGTIVIAMIALIPEHMRRAWQEWRSDQRQIDSYSNSLTAVVAQLIRRLIATPQPREAWAFNPLDVQTLVNDLRSLFPPGLEITELLQSFVSFMVDDAISRLLARQGQLAVLLMRLQFTADRFADSLEIPEPEEEEDLQAVAMAAAVRQARRNECRSIQSGIRRAQTKTALFLSAVFLLSTAELFTFYVTVVGLAADPDAVQRIGSLAIGVAVMLALNLFVHFGWFSPSATTQALAMRALPSVEHPSGPRPFCPTPRQAYVCRLAAIVSGVLLALLRLDTLGNDNGIALVLLLLCALCIPALAFTSSLCLTKVSMVGAELACAHRDLNRRQQMLIYADIEEQARTLRREKHLSDIRDRQSRQRQFLAEYLATNREIERLLTVAVSTILQDRIVRAEIRHTAEKILRLEKNQAVKTKPEVAVASKAHQNDVR